MSSEEGDGALKHCDPGLSANPRHLMHLLVFSAESIYGHLQKIAIFCCRVWFTRRSLPISLSLRFPCQWIAGESCSTLWICRSSSLIWLHSITSVLLSFCLWICCDSSLIWIVRSHMSIFGFPQHCHHLKFWVRSEFALVGFVSSQLVPRWLCCNGQGHIYLFFFDLSQHFH